MPRKVEVDIDFAALGINVDSLASAGGGEGGSGGDHGSSKRKKKGKRGHRAHRRSQVSTDVLADIDPLDIGGKKPSTRGLRNQNHAPVSYEQPAWVNGYKDRGSKKSRRSNGGTTGHEGKQGGRSPRRQVNTYVGEGKTGGTPREERSSHESKTGGRSRREVEEPGLTPRLDSAGSNRSKGSSGRSGRSSRRSGKSKSEKTRSNASLKSQTQPKKAAAAFPSINGARSVASLMSAAAGTKVDIQMHAVGVTKKTHDKPVSMKKSFVGTDRSKSSGADAFLRRLSPDHRSGGVRKTMTGFM